MLPFLNPKKMSSTIIAKVSPSGDLKSEGVEGEEDMGMMAAAEDILSAIAMKDAAALAKALRAGVELCQMGPAVEEEME